MVQSSAFRLLSVVITLLLIAVLSVLVVLTLRSQPSVTIKPAPTSTPTASPTATATTYQTLGADLVVPDGGYRVRPLIGYEATIQDASVTLTRVVSSTHAGGASTVGFDARTRAALGVRPNQALQDVLVQVAQTFALQTKADAGAIETLRVGDADAAALSLLGELAGEAVVGRVVVVQPDDKRIFIAAATAPLDIWEMETAAALDTMLQSVEFFEPDTAAAESTVTATPRPLQTPARPEVILATPAPAETVRAQSTTPTAPATPTAVITVTTLLVPTPTPTTRTIQPWSAVTDGNYANDLIISGNTIWVATDGGALALTSGGKTPVKFTSINGLNDNQLTAVADCALPELGVLFGSNAGLQIVDPRAGGWRQLDSRNSELSYDDVSALACDPEAGYLVVGYARHGIDIFEEASGEWLHLDRNSGLASNNVRALAVVGALDEIWVVSDDGITVSAGADSTFYNAENSPLESNRIGSILAGEDGAIWLGGDGALYRVEGERWSVYSAEEVGDAGFPLRLITGLAPAGDGTLWLGDIDGALCRFDPVERICTDAFAGQPGMAAGPLTSLRVRDGGELYYTTAGDGFSIYNGQAWQQFVNRSEGVRGNAVRAATVDSNGVLWAVTDAGVQRIDGTSGALEMLPAPSIDAATIQAIHAAENGDIWIGGDGAGVWNGDAWTIYTTTAGLAGDTVQAIDADSRGRVWLGTESGVSIWNGESFFNLTRETGLPSDDIRALQPDGDSMWIGSAGGGLYRVERNQLEIFNAENMDLPSDFVTALEIAADGPLLVGTDGGAAELRNGIAAPLPAIGERAVTHILVLDGTTWIGTDGDGLFFDTGEGWRQETTEGALPSNQITALESAGGTVWVGGRTGGFARYAVPIKE